MSRKALSVVVATVVALLMVGSAAAMPADWWNNSWHYRVNVTVDTSGYNRTEWPVEYSINFSNFSLQGPLDNLSIRVIEFNTTTNASNEIPSQFDEGKFYDNVTNAYGEVVWLINGTRLENTILQYYIYFDTANFGLKSPPDYESNLTYVDYGSGIFGAYNDYLDLRVHTDPNTNHTSGLYYARFNVSDDVFFDSGIDNPIEHVRYKDDSPSQNVSYAFINNFEVEHAGPVRITVKQEGDEAVWGSQPVNYTGDANMTKRYTFYQKNQWIKIEHILTAKVQLQRNIDSDDYVLFWDIGRTNMNYNSETGSDIEPYSWASVYEITPAQGIGLINIEQSSPGNKYSVADFDFVNEWLWVNYEGSETLNPGQSISETAAVLFNDKESHAPVTDLRNRFMDDTVEAQYLMEERTVSLVPNTTFDIYNRNETVLITGNITSDDYNLSYSANATLTSPSLANTSVNLVKNGSIYEGNYTIGITDEIGVWTLTTRTYDDNEFLLNTTQKAFTVNDTYTVDIILLNPIGLVNQSMWANVTVRTIRNDTGIPGIAWPNISCAYYNASDASQFTNLTDSNISEAATGFGNYTANWSGPTEGYWNLTCNVSRFNNNGNFTVTFLTTVKNTTTVVVTLNATQWLSAPYNVSHVKWNTNQTFNARFNVTNIELGLAQDVNVSINFTDTGWYVRNVPNPYPIGDLLPLETRMVDIEITVPNRTTPTPPLYNVTANATWRNFIDTHNETTDWFNVTVEQNPVMEVLQTQINLTIWENSTDGGHFTIFSAGNYDMGPTSYSCTSDTQVCNDFGPAFAPAGSIGTRVAGNLTNVTVDFTIPDGWPNGTYVGNLTINYNNAQFANVTVNITVPASKNWTANTTSCSKAALPNDIGDICEVEIENTGNVPLQFNITPYTLSTLLENYTWSNRTLFTVGANTTEVILIRHNTTGASPHTNHTNYTINATDPLANPNNRTVNATLDVVLGPDLGDWNISTTELAQLDNLTIDVTITDRLLVGNNASDIWVSANISYNGTYIETVNLTNTTPLTPGATSNWSLNYTNTTARGINFSVTVFTQDMLGGYNESTSEKNFTVYAKLVLDITPNRESLRYDPGDTAKFYIVVNDSNFEPLDGASVTIDIYDANDWLVDTKTETTTSDGKAVTDTFIVDEPIGDWSWIAEVEYYDSVVGKNVTANTSGKFKVDYEKIVDVQTDDTHYKGTTFPVKIYITQKGNLVNVSGNVTVQLVYNSSTIQTVTATHMGDYYEATMSLDTDAETGAYLAKVYADDGAGEPYAGYKAFDVPETTAESLTLDLAVGSVYRPGDIVEITGFLSDQDNQYHAGANITLTITDPNNIAVVLYMTSVNSTTPPKYTANYTLPDNAPSGPYILFGDTTFSSIYAADVNVFTVSESLFAQIEINPVVYINQTMDIGITVIDPVNGQGVDPDQMTLLLYNTENGTLTLWKNLTLSGGDFTAGDTGLYSYNETVDNTTTAGSYVALLEIREGSLRGWSMESFSISSGVFDVRIDNLPGSITSGADLPFNIILTYFGEAVTRDVKVKYWIENQGYDNGAGEDVANPDPGVPTTLSRNFTSVNLPAGTYTLWVSVLYDQAQPAASAFTKFTVAGDDTPPSSPGGGGGGPAEKEEGIPKLSIIELIPPEVLVEKGGFAYLVVSVQNLGGADVNNVSVNIMGVPEDWFEVINGERGVLTSGEGSNIIVQFKVPENIMAQTIKLTVQATNRSEVSDQREVTMRIFASRYDLVHFEIQSVKKTMRNAEDRALRAIGDGRNASEVMEKIEEVKVELRSAEDFLSNHEYEKSLSHLDGARDLLEHVNELLEALRAQAAPAPPAPVVTPAPGLGISTPVLMFMFFVIAALGGIIMYLTRDQITGILGAIGMPTVKLKGVGRGRPIVKKTRTRRVSAEVVAQADSLNSEIANTERLLGTMKGQHEAGLISDSTYKELKKRNDDKIKMAKSKLKKIGG